MKKIILSAIFATFTMSMSYGQAVNADANNIANNGYDVVNYFTTVTAERGSSTFSTEHNGANYYFVNAENLKSFKDNPAAYLPQFDGYCSFAVAKMNKKVPVDPETFRIDDGKLYLFFNDFWEGKPFNTMVPWIDHESDMEKMAMTNWKTLQGN